MNEQGMPRHEQELVALEDTLKRMRFATPPMRAIWAPTARPVGRRLWGLRPFYLAAALTLVLGGMAYGTSRILPSLMGTPGASDCPVAQCGSDFQVTAQMSDDPRGVRAFDVVVTDSTPANRLATIAEGLATSNDNYRVIVWFFSNAAGQERHQFPVLPSVDAPGEAAPAPLSVSAWLATYDFHLSASEPVVTVHSGN